MIDPVKQIIVVRKDLLIREEEQMTPGKMAAQVAHASMEALLEIATGKPYLERESRDEDYDIALSLKKGEPLKEWLEGSFTKVVLYVKTEKKLLELADKIRDAGFVVSLIQDTGKTIFSEPTYTCFGVEPARHSEIYPLVKRARLLT
jgi:PTH2 family peptidyl-tRNA hydrolase